MPRIMNLISTKYSSYDILLCGYDNIVSYCFVTSTRLVILIYFIIYYIIIVRVIGIKLEYW